MSGEQEFPGGQEEGGAGWTEGKVTKSPEERKSLVCSGNYKELGAAKQSVSKWGGQ